MSALICGSIAYDNIMVFQGRFKEHILADQIHILNVSFLVPELRREFGGCAGNIAYNLRLLGGEPRIMATVGSDFGSYRAWLLRHGVNLDYLNEVPEMLTAQAYITTDLDDNQITAFHPGAMNEAHRNVVPAKAGISVGIVSPDGRQGMLDHAGQLHAAGIPFVFDPGQGLPMFDGDDLRHFVELATWVAVNDYEARLLMDRTGWSEADVASRVKALIVTRGAQGSTIWTGAGQLDIPVVKPAAILDPTGCGDAYRAGLLHGISRGLPWADSGRLAALLGSIKIAHRGTQNHAFTPTSLQQEFRLAFGHDLRL
ncbi:MAG: carbohydrate kinase family protein [Gammaproteobacteria bacterium]|nr:carbohydrate kinase family protein [Gammaproteobacteria bacterium]